MKIVVMGAGAIGGFLGGKLAHAGHKVTIIDRPALVDKVRAEGLRVIEPSGTFTAKVEAVTVPGAAFDSRRPADLVLLAVKTFDTARALDDLRPYGAQIRNIITFQNGLSSPDRLAEAFTKTKVLSGTITHPVVVPELGVVRSEKATGGIGIASPAGQSVESWVERFSDAGVVARAYASYRSMLWSKLLLNIIGNASSAILNMNTMRVFADRRLVWLEVMQLREAVRVMRAQKIKPVALPGYPVPLLVAAVRFLPTALLGPVMRPLVVKGRAEKLPSLLIELNRGSGKSEVDEINGAVVREGARVRVSTPINAILDATLNLLTQAPAQRESWNENIARLVLVARAAQRRPAGAETLVRSGPDKAP